MSDQSSAGPAAKDLLRRYKESLFPSVGLLYDEPIELRWGERQYVYDTDGRQYLDFFGGIVTVLNSAKKRGLTVGKGWIARQHAADLPAADRFDAGC